MPSIFGRRPKPEIDWNDQRAIRDEVGARRALLAAAEQAVAEAAAALDAHLARRETLGIAVSVARREAWKPADDSMIVRNPLDPGSYLNLGADADDEAKAVLAGRMRLWEEGEEQEQRLRVALTAAGQRRSALRGQVRGLQDRLDQLKAGPPARPDPNRLPGGGVAGLMAAASERR